MVTKEVRHVSFTDRMSASIYSEDMVRDLVNGNYDPRKFAPGTVSKVVRNVQVWHGSHDDGTRAFETIEKQEISLDYFRS
jgi:hypothetical protein